MTLVKILWLLIGYGSLGLVGYLVYWFISVRNQQKRNFVNEIKLAGEKIKFEDDTRSLVDIVADDNKSSGNSDGSSSGNNPGSRG